MTPYLRGVRTSAIFSALVFSAFSFCVGCAPNATNATNTTGAPAKSAATTGRDAIAGPPNLPFSAAVRSGDLVFLSGMIGTDPATGQLADGIAAQTEQIFKNARTVLAAAGLDLGRVTKCTVFLTNITDYAAFNEVYAKQFDKPYPARTTVGTSGLSKGALIELEMIAR